MFYIKLNQIKFRVFISYGVHAIIPLPIKARDINLIQI